MTTLSMHRGTLAIRRMVEIAPATGGLALWIAHRDLADEDARAAAPVVTDGATLFYAAAFDDLPLARQIGHVAHAVLHVALMHNVRFAKLQLRLGDADLALFNLCADAIINSALGHLPWLELPPDAIMLDRLLADTLHVDQPVDKALLEWDVERLYRTILDGAVGAKRSARPGGQGSDAEATRLSAKENHAPSAAKRHDAPGTRADGPREVIARSLAARSAIDLLPAAQSLQLPEDAARSHLLWRERLTRAHAGDGEFSMLRHLLADIPRTRTPWEQILRTRLASGLSRRPEVSWSRPSRSWIANRGRAGSDRRMPWEPGWAATATAPRLAVMVDNSGSIDAGLLDRFAAELASITRRAEADMVLVVGDDRVRRVTRLPAGAGLREDMACAGGGQTDFTALLEEADSHRPDIGVFLTDLEGPARFRPRWPLFWAVPCHMGTPAVPFGQLLVLE